MSDGDSDFDPHSEPEEENVEKELPEEEYDEEEEEGGAGKKKKGKGEGKGEGKSKKKDDDAGEKKPKRRRKSKEEKEDESAAKKAPLRYIVDMAKSGRADCRRCEEKISKGLMRIGTVEEGLWGPMTKWYHTACCIFQKHCTSVEEVEGYEELPEEELAALADRVEKSKNETDPELQPLDTDELVRTEWDQKMEEPAGLNATLLSFQKEGLAWMCNQEDSKYKGGIIADEMGMGKTIQAISLMLAHRPEAKERKKKEAKAWTEAEATTTGTGFEEPGDVSKRGGTLVICPLIAMLQWKSEIEKFTEKGSLKVHIHHGSSRTTDPEDLRQADVVLTTYSIVEAEHRKMTAGQKVACPDCKKKLYPDKMVQHRKYFCGAAAELTAAQAKTERKKPKGSSSSGKGGGGSSSKSASATTVLKRSKGRNKVVDDDSDEDQEEETEGMTDPAAVKAAAASKARKSKAAAAKSKPSGKGGSTQTTRIPATTKLSKGKGTKRKRGDDGDDNDDSDVEMTVGPSTPRGGAKKAASARKGAGKGTGKKGKRGAADDDGDDGDGDDDDDDSDVEVLSGPPTTTILGGGKKGQNKRAGAKGKGKGKGKAGDADDDDDDDGDDSEMTTTTTLLPTKGKSKGKGKGKTKKKKGRRDDDDDEEEDGDDDDDCDDDDDDDFGSSERKAGRGVGRKVKAGPPSVLHAVSWHRVVLDEAHYIKDRATSTAKAVYALTSLYKWSLTGTPLQNRVGELYSLVRFLRLDPHAYYMCRGKNCDCKSLSYKFGPNGRQCEICGHSPMQHNSVFNKYILNPISRAGPVGEGKRAFLHLKNEVLDKILLRRTKQTRSKDICLPPRIVRVRSFRLDKVEEDFYQGLYTQSQTQFNDYVANGVILNNYAHIFACLTKLRQAVDHPYLVVHSRHAGEGAGEDKMETHGYDSDQGEEPASPGKEAACEDLDCEICQSPAEAPVTATCGHSFCRGCVDELINSAVEDTRMECPKCSEPLTVDLSPGAQQPAREGKGKGGGKAARGGGGGAGGKGVSKDKAQASTGMAPVDGTVVKLSNLTKHSIMKRINLDQFQTSTKLEALMQSLGEMQEKDPAAKAIVFSQYVSFLEIMEWRIKSGGVGCVKLSGNMSVDVREQVLCSFREDPDTKVLLISLRAGGVALNLTVANHIFLMDPWWNPCAEMQAIDRTHRMGQCKPIIATRFVIEDTIEERILRLQEKKKLVFDGTVGGDAASLARLTVDDLRFLFSS